LGVLFFDDTESVAEGHESAIRCCRKKDEVKMKEGNHPQSSIAIQGHSRSQGHDFVAEFQIEVAVEALLICEAPSFRIFRSQSRLSPNSLL
jgi:hypothetical protein